MLLKPILAGFLLLSSMVLADPITLTRADGSTEGVSYGACIPTPIQDTQIISIQFSAVTTCLLYDDSTCQTNPINTLEPTMFNAGSNIRKGDNSELIGHYFICSANQ